MFSICCHLISSGLKVSALLASVSVLLWQEEGNFTFPFLVYMQKQTLPPILKATFYFFFVFYLLQDNAMRKSNMSAIADQCYFLNYQQLSRSKNIKDPEEKMSSQ